MTLVLLVVVTVAAIVVAAVVGFAVALTRRSTAQLAAGMRSVPGMPTDAPPEWAGAHSPEARMHRQLISLAASVAVIPLGDATAIERRSAVEQRIRELDRRLIELAVVPEAARRDAVATMQSDVDTVAVEAGALASEPPIR